MAAPTSTPSLNLSELSAAAEEKGDSTGQAAGEGSSMGGTDGAGGVKERVVVVGSGPAGLFAALSLAEAGVPVTLLERYVVAGQRKWSVLRLGEGGGGARPRHRRALRAAGAQRGQQPLLRGGALHLCHTRVTRVTFVTPTTLCAAQGGVESNRVGL
eukprot:6046787-Pyramimonas_sp.AAC.1